MCPTPIAEIPMSTIEIEWTKNNSYILRDSRLYKWKDHPLKEVIEPQRPTTSINLFFFWIDNELKNPNKKQPITFTIKISSICHRNKAPETDPSDIRK